MLKILIKLKNFSNFYIFEFMFTIFIVLKDYFELIKISFFLKKKTKKFIILKSPFVNKKAKDQYGFDLFSSRFSLKFNFLFLNRNLFLIFFKSLIKTININNIIQSLTLTIVSRRF